MWKHFNVSKEDSKIIKEAERFLFLRIFNTKIYKISAKYVIMDMFE